MMRGSGVVRSDSGWTGWVTGAGSAGADLAARTAGFGPRTILLGARAVGTGGLLRRGGGMLPGTTRRYVASWSRTTKRPRRCASCTDNRP